MNKLTALAIELNKINIHTVPCNQAKEPISKGTDGNIYNVSISKNQWGETQTVADINKHFPTDYDHLGVIAGKQLIIIDFDIKNCPSYGQNKCDGNEASNSANSVWTRFCDKLQADNFPIDTLYFEKSMSGGRHIIYKVAEKLNTKEYSNLKLATIVKPRDYGVKLQDNWQNVAAYVLANPFTANAPAILDANWLEEMYQEFQKEISARGIKTGNLQPITRQNFFDLFAGEIWQRIEARGVEDIAQIILPTLDAIAKTGEDLTQRAGEFFDYFLSFFIKNTALNNIFGAAIETRANLNSYCLVAPSKGYHALNSSLMDLPTLTHEEHIYLMNVAKSFSNNLETVRIPKIQPNAPQRFDETGEKVGTKYNEQPNVCRVVTSLLTKNGWAELYERGGNIYLRRPNKNESVSACVRVSDGTLYVFTTSTLFEAEKGYSPFAVYATLEHNGNYTNAAKALAPIYGTPYTPKMPTFTGAIVQQAQPRTTAPATPNDGQNVTLNVTELQKYIAQCVKDSIKQLSTTQTTIPTNNEISIDELLKNPLFHFDVTHEYKRIAGAIQMVQSHKEYNICESQGLIAITGKSKAGKSNVANCIIASALSGLPTLQFVVNLDGRKVILFDTEQTMTQVANNVRYKIQRYAQIQDNKLTDQFHAFSLMEFAPYDRLAIVEKILQYLAPNKNEIGLVVLDGIRDLLHDSNDNKEADALIQRIMQLTQKYGCIIATVIHTNEGNNLMQGHLGRAIARKCSHTIEVLREDLESSERQIKSRNARIDTEFPTFNWYLNENGHPVLSNDLELPTDKIDFGGSISNSNDAMNVF